MGIRDNIRPLLRRSDRGVRRLGRNTLLAATVGVVAGLGAIVFHIMCMGVNHYALEGLTHYEQSGPRNEIEWPDVFPTPPAQFEKTTEATHIVPWLLILVPLMGGLVSGVLVYTIAPEAEGHGTDAAIDSYHNKRGVIRPRVPLVKMFASAITLGTGGSGGREGPIAQIGAGFGSYLATRLRLSDAERRAMLAAGLGAGIGAIFHAPLAGAIFACEVLYRDPDFESENLIPSFIATTVAYSVFSLAFGKSAFEPLFAVAHDLSFTRPLPWLLPLAVLALVMAFASLVYTVALSGAHRLFRRLPVPRMLRPAIGSMLTGVLAVALFYGLAGLGGEAQRDGLSVLSFGYGFLQKVLANELPTGFGVAVTLLLAVGLGKILSTALTIGSGGSGGVFGPSMVVGGCLGAVVGLIFHFWLPNIVEAKDVSIFAILGMASFFAAAANTPVSTLIMVSEMCSSYVLLLPSMWVCALAYLVSRNWSVYEKQVHSRRESAAHRGDFVIDVLQGMSVREAMGHATSNYVSATRDMPLRNMLKLLTDTRQTCFPVVDEQKHYVGVFSLNDIRQFIYDSPVADLAVAEDLANTEASPLTLQMDLSSAIGRFAEGGFEELPVVDAQAPQEVVGLLRRQDLIAAYSARLLAMRGAENVGV
jgi:CIC family chloride channel protein